MPWQCAGCGKEAADRVRNCDCATSVLFRMDGDKMQHEIKIDHRERGIEESLRQISRMRVMPDDKINRTTLHAAIEIAKLHFTGQE